MALSLYAATIPTYLQILGSVNGLIDKAESFCAETGIAPGEIIGARLFEDMHPFAYQVKSTAVHSIGAIEGLRRGSFSPDRTPPPDSFKLLRERIDGTIAALKAIDPSEVDAFVGREVSFVAGEFRWDYTGEDFLLSFAQPNFYFHATTAYDILRMKGVKIGKRDFLGQQRLKK
jgi:hypothetical protein